MFLKKSISNGKIYLSFVQGYRNENGKVKQKTIKKLGYLDELKKEYDDPIAFFKAIAIQKNSEDITEYTIKNLNNKEIDENDTIKNLGYIILKKVYNDLGLKDLLNEYQKDLEIEYNLNDILSFLVYMRVLKPGSKKETFDNKDLLFEKCDFSLNDIYRSLSILTPLKEKIEKTIWHNTKDKYNRDTSKCYYDCTNYYFEIEYNDDDIYECDCDGNPIKDDNGNPILKEEGLRKRGPEKNKRPDPIVEMGLLMDASQIPISFDIFAGNKSEKLSLLPIFNRTKKDCNLQRTIIVADRGLNTSDNITLISGTSIEQAQKLNGYVYGQSVRGADEEFKKWILEQNYKTDIILDDDGNEIKFIHKSRVHPKNIQVKRKDKNKTKSGNTKIETIQVDQKQMVYYSQKYADKQKNDREKIIAKAKDLIAHPDKYSRATSYGVAGYINNLAFVKSTGEIASDRDLSINQDRINEEEKYDGYYSIVTSEEHLSDFEIRNIYRGLSKIEETFKVTKSGLESRPIWLSRKDRIISHFLTCFIALVLIRLLEKKLNNKYCFNQIISSIRNYTSTNIEHDLYKQSFKNSVINDFENKFNINLSKKFLTLSEIKKMLNL